MEETRRHPEWKHAAQIIIERVELEGYGFIVSMEELQELFSMPDLPKQMTQEEYQKNAFKLLTNIEKLKEELLENNICLYNVRGTGYQTLTPNDQVEKVPPAYIKKARRLITQSIRVLTCVNDELLAKPVVELKVHQMAKLAFIVSAMNKKKIPAQTNKKDANQEQTSLMVK